MWELRDVPSELRSRYLSDGHWTDDTFASFFEREIGAAPDLTFRSWSKAHPYDGTTGALYQQGLRLAGSLQRLGIGAGDVVAYQVPNWAEAAISIYAGFRLGAVMVPLVHFYGAREVEFILRQCGARAFISVDRFGHIAHLENLLGFRDRLDRLEHVILVRSGEAVPELPGALEFESLLEASPYTGTPDIDPDSPAMVGYTSGTTSDPKGVVHTHRSLLFEVGQLANMLPNTPPILNAAPMAHMTGMLGSLLCPVYSHKAIHVTDQWDPQEALRIMVEADISAGAGVTVFLTSLLDAPGFGPEHLKRMPAVGLGAAPVPAAVGERAEALGISVTRSYGSTEHPSITGSPLEAPRDKRIRTDGRPLGGVEIRLVDVEGDGESEVGPGIPGEIVSRGPDLFAGYTDPALTERVMLPGGWYRTGDVGVQDEDGYLTLTDRISDIIIRGGTNLSAAEIEEALMTHQSVTECAVVSAPDDRLGEYAYAVLRLRPNAEAPDLQTVQRHLGSCGLPKKKWVEGVKVVEDFPRTPSGKIRKFVVRDEVKREGPMRGA